MKEYSNTETVKKETRNEKMQIVEVDKINDLPSKLAARRRIMAEEAGGRFFCLHNMVINGNIPLR